MEEKKKILLTEELTQKLINTPETGMGYHLVDIYLKDGRIITNLIVLNCSILKIDKSIKISSEDIVNIIISGAKNNE